MADNEQILPTRKWIKDHAANDLDVWHEHVRLQHPDLHLNQGWEIVHRHAEDHQAKPDTLDHHHSPRR